MKVPCILDENTLQLKPLRTVMTHLSKPARKYIHRSSNTYDAYEPVRLLRDGRPSLRQDQRVHQLRLIKAFYTNELPH